MIAYDDYMRNLKEKKRITNQQLADKSGVPASSVQRIIAGQTDNPSFQTICDIVMALDGSLDEMVGISKTEEKDNAPSTLQILEESISYKNRWITRLFITCCIIVAFVLIVTMLDVLNGGIGYVRY